MIRSRKILTTPTIRVIPIVMMLALLMLAVRIYDIVIGGHALNAQILTSNAYAATPEEKKEDTKEHSQEDSADHKEEADAGETNDDVFATRGDVKANKPEEAAAAQQKDFSPVEVDLLQSLASRREKLDIWEDEVAMKEQLLKATELRIEGKLAELKKLQKNVQKLLDKYDMQEESEIASLVKMYESMKPKKAAAILNGLDMNVLFKVIDGMSERRAAPVLAAMSPERARSLTQELAIQMQIRDEAKKAITP